MSGDTEIDWTHKVWNVTRGCSRKSPGCGGKRGEGGCYAEKIAGRFSGPGLPYEGLATIGKQGARWTGKVILVQQHLTDPLRWRRPAMIFVNSMSDLFHEALRDEQIDEVFGIIAASQWWESKNGDIFPWHVYQILTKRADRQLDYMSQDRREQWARAAMNHCTAKDPDRLFDYIRTANGPLPRVWLGVSAENQEEADRRLPDLRRTPAAIRFVSVEPQLEPVRLRNYLGNPHNHGPGQHGVDVETGGVNWVIAGAESGAGARPFQPAWAAALRDECKEFQVPFFYKQDATPKGKKIRHPRLDGEVYHEYPAGFDHVTRSAVTRSAA